MSEQMDGAAQGVERVMAAIRRDVQCDVQAGHPVGLLFNGADVRQSVVSLVVGELEACLGDPVLKGDRGNLLARLADWRRLLTDEEQLRAGTLR